MSDQQIRADVRKRAEQAVEPLRRHAASGHMEFHTVADAIVTAIAGLADDVLGTYAPDSIPETSNGPDNVRPGLKYYWDKGRTKLSDTSAQETI